MTSSPKGDTSTRFVFFAIPGWRRSKLVCSRPDADGRRSCTCIASYFEGAKHVATASWMQLTGHQYIYKYTAADVYVDLQSGNNSQLSSMDEESSPPQQQYIEINTIYTGCSALVILQSV